MPSRLLAGLLVLLVSGFCFLLCTTPLASMDLWWHLRTGAEIVRTGELPQTDWYTYTDAGRPWIDLHWGFQVLVHALYQLGGIDLLILAKAALTTLAVLLVWRGAGRGVRFSSGALVIALVAIVVSGQAIVRPKMLTLVALALCLLICKRADQKQKALLALVPLQILWTNVQGLFVLGPIIATCWLIDRLVGRLLTNPAEASSPEQGSARFDIGVVCAVWLACLVNPYGIDGALFPFELWKKFSVDQEIYSIVLAFQRPVDFVGDHGYFRGHMLFQAGLFVIGLISFLPKLRRAELRLFHALLYLAFSILAWKAIRNADLFAVVSGFVILGNFSEARRGPIQPLEQQSALGSVGGIIVLLGLFLALFTNQLFALAGDGRVLGLGERENWYMHGPVEFASQPSMPAGAFVRHNGQAAVYIHETGPGRKVFMDGRLEVATKETLARFHEISRLMAAGDVGFEDLIRLPNGKLPAVLLDSLFSREEINGMLLLPTHWHLVFQDKSGVVFLDATTAKQLGHPDLFQ